MEDIHLTPNTLIARLIGKTDLCDRNIYETPSALTSHNIKNNLMCLDQAENGENIMLLSKLFPFDSLASSIVGDSTESLKVGDFLAKSNLDIYIEDGVATLCGFAGTESDSQAAEIMALRIEGVDKVHNYASFT